MRHGGRVAEREGGVHAEPRTRLGELSHAAVPRAIEQPVEEELAAALSAAP